VLFDPVMVLLNQCINTNGLQSIINNKASISLM
jgi:hypothetical protein